MRRVIVLTQKELVEKERLNDATAVVIDVFLATSTIAFLLEYGYDPVYTANDGNHACDIQEKEQLFGLMLGEKNGEAIEGFEYPDPTLIQKVNKKQSAIICSTNGTRAVESANLSESLLLSSLVNGHMVAKHIHQKTDSETIVIICAGNAGHFSAEDFVGAGQLVDHLWERENYSFSDSAKLARDAFLKEKANNYKGLLEKETSKLLRDTGFAESMDLIIQSVEMVHVLPMYVDGKIQNLNLE
ncbi:2-phosphosulfolactate phosphatase [Thalassobacillus devorans]|nr:2-phosphosulfolactate phosphatase [Thalassobacillus devorans]